MTTPVLVLAYAAAAAAASLRWLRVAQREHYHAGRVSVFAGRWWRASTLNVGLGVLGVLAAALAPFLDGWAAAAAGVTACAVVVAGPVGLGLRGRTSSLAWTRRLRVLAATVTVLSGASAALLALLVEPAWLGLLAVAHPLVVDAALAITGPIERLANERYVRSARSTLSRVEPIVVGITGSYGKTTVKNYAAHLVRRSRKVLASRASFNNRLGLARSVNEDLEPGTEVFLAEMGTYGPGEIRDMCSWLRPTIGVITAIGPVHLERMGSIERIVAAKSEILEDVNVAVLNVDVAELRELATEVEGAGTRVVRCSATDAGADVLVRRRDDTLEIVVGDRSEEVPVPHVELTPANLATSLGIAVALDAVPPSLEGVVADVPAVENRLTVLRREGGPTVLDDTYNSNPAGARRALEALDELTTDKPGRAVLVTPGMVELGHRQADENRAFARDASGVASDVIVVGHTNRRDLLAGLHEGGGADVVNVVTVAHRDEAVAWTRENLGLDDVVLFENDLPDHFP